VVTESTVLRLHSGVIAQKIRKIVIGPCPSNDDVNAFDVVDNSSLVFWRYSSASNSILYYPQH
jgi:hypothetical protein